MEFFGPQLQTKDGLKDTAEVLSGKYVGIYFSAHWCPPCRGFTPQLAKAYSEHLKAKDLEIVFVSSDKDEAAFNDYFGEMPWVPKPVMELVGDTLVGKDGPVPASALDGKVLA